MLDVRCWALRVTRGALFYASSNPEWAAKFRHNLFAYNIVPQSKYFLLALPDFLYLWKNNSDTGIIPPDYTFKTFNVLQKYLTLGETEPKYISEEGLQLALTSWLEEMAHSSEKPKAGTDSYKLLVESGLLDAMSRAEVIVPDHL